MIDEIKNQKDQDLPVSSPDLPIGNPSQSEDHVLIIQFKGSSAEFGYSRQNVSTQQLYAAVGTLLKIADLETESWHLQILAREQQKNQILRPTGIQLGSDLKGRKR